MAPRKPKVFHEVIAEAYGKVTVIRETTPDGTYLILRAKLEDAPGREYGVKVVSKKTPPNPHGQ